MNKSSGSANSTEIEHAQQRLEQVLTEKRQRDQWDIRTELAPKAAKELGRDGFQIERKSNTSLLVKGAEKPGVANSLYYLATCFRSGRHLPGVGETLTSKPRFNRRGMTLGAFAPLRLRDLSLDIFTLEQYKEYLEFIRELGGNHVLLMPGPQQWSHPDHPSTIVNRRTWETLKEALAYAKELGMSTAVNVPYNWMPGEYSLCHPEQLVRNVMGFASVSWDKARESIRRYHDYFYRHFQVDEMVIMSFDGGGTTLDRFIEEPNQILEEAFEEAAHVFRSAVPKGIITWWAFGASHFQTAAKALGYNVQLDMGKLMRSLPENTRFMEASANLWRKIIPDAPEYLSMASEAGLPVDNFFFIMDPEGASEAACSTLPYPKLGAVQDEMRYTVEHLSVDGVLGYRMCPPIQVIGDYAFFRWAWDPTLDSSEIVDEAARYMNRGGEGAGDIAHAIRLLEEFWTSCDLHKLDECYRILEAPGASSTTDLMNLRDGVAVLRIVARAAFETEPNSEGRELMFQQLVDLIQAMPVYKGYTTEEVWIGRISEFLRLKSGWWMNFLRSLKEGKPLFTV
jgi:hypothetical protein